MNAGLSCRGCDRTIGDGATICLNCSRSMLGNLQRVPGLVDDMTITRVRLDRMSRGRLGGKSAEVPLPIRLDSFDHRPTDRPLDNLTNVVSTWTRDVADYLGIDSAALWTALDSPGLLALTLNNRSSKAIDNAELSMTGTAETQLAAIWLLCQGDRIRHHPAAGEMLDDLADAITLAQRAVDRLPEVAYKGTCQAIDQSDGRDRICGFDLYVERGEQWLRCGRCNTQHEVKELDRQILAQMREMNYTLPEAISLLAHLNRHVPKSTVYNWANDRSNRKLRPRGWKHNGRITDVWIHRNDPAVYRLGDVLDLADQHGGRR